MVCLANMVSRVTSDAVCASEGLAWTACVLSALV